MKNYIMLDGYKYATNASNWRPVYAKPHTERRTLSGAIDITYGPVYISAWEGEINAPVTAREVGWGTISQLRTTLEKRQAVTLVDHTEVTYNVHCLGEHIERSLLNVWDSADNVFYVSVRLVIS